MTRREDREKTFLLPGAAVASHRNPARAIPRARVELDMIHNLESQYLRLQGSGLEFLPFVGSLTPVGATVGQCLRCEASWSGEAIQSPLTETD